MLLNSNLSSDFNQITPSQSQLPIIIKQIVLLLPLVKYHKLDLMNLVGLKFRILDPARKAT
jgi:hypothetical protein